MAEEEGGSEEGCGCGEVEWKEGEGLKMGSMLECIAVGFERRGY